MPPKTHSPVRFSFLTAIIWLLVAAGIIFILWKAIDRLSTTQLPISTPTADLTQVYQTITAMLNVEGTLTQDPASRTATPGSSANTTRTPTQNPKRSATPGVQLTATLPLPCDLAAAGSPLDITIPDDTLLEPGQSFIKTWKLVNAGSCTWTGSYSARFFYGDRMGAEESIPLGNSVLPGKSVELSVEMVSPLAAGTYQGNWKLSNPAGELFGIGSYGDAPFWVRIIVSQIPSQTATPEASATLSPTEQPSPTPTPPVQARGKLQPLPGNSLDLDKLVLNGGDEDLLYQVDANQYHWLTPQNGAVMGVFGSLEPLLGDCQSAKMSPAPIAVESLALGTYLCYTTNQGRAGRALFEALDGNTYMLTLDLVTWALP